MTNGSDPEQPDRSDEADLSDVRRRLDALDDKLGAHRPKADGDDADAAKRTGYGLAVRVSSDFIAAIFVGGALGWFLDSVAGTGPFGLIVLLLLGFAAGVLNVMRTLGLVAPAPSQSARRDDTGKNERDGG
ncbi:MAG: AtpZ/AtpI family protein [Cohaesibacteraceae bacterium]